jgi:GntR family transcriptional regulator
MAGPLYQQIADELRRKTDSGELAPGDRLPTEDELMEQYHLSRNTIRGAISQLAVSGLVITMHGKGTFVAERVNPIVTTLTTDPETGSGGDEGLVYTAEVAASGRKATTGGFKLEVQQADPAVADALRISPGSQVVSRHEQRFVDGHPWSLQTSFYPQSMADRAPRLQQAANIDEGTVNYLRGYGVEQVGYRDAIEVRSPNQDEKTFFDLPADGRIQVIEIYRIAFDQHHTRFRLTVTVYRADRNHFIFNVGDVPISEDLPSGS